MFVRASTLVLAIAASVIAAPGGVTTPTTVAASQCDTGNLSCCNQTMGASDFTNILTSLLGIPGLLDTPINGLVGTGCSPITIIGTGSSAVCQQEPVCCDNNSMTGFINVGCTPVNLNL